LHNASRKSCWGDELPARAAEKYQSRSNARALGSSFLDNFQGFVNTRILGRDIQPSEKDSITKVSLSNNKTCLFVDHFSELIDFVFKGR